MVTGYPMIIESLLYPILADTFCEITVVFVKGMKECLVLHSDALIGIAHHLSRYKRFTVGYALVMLDKLRLDVVKCEVDVTGLLALSFDLVGFGVPHVHRYGMLATELRLASIDCDPPHNRDNTVFLLASVHKEQDFECCSHTPCFLCAKLVSHALNGCKQTAAERRKSTLIR